MDDDKKPLVPDDDDEGSLLFHGNQAHASSHSDSGESDSDSGDGRTVHLFEISEGGSQPEHRNWNDLIAFWIFGLTNNYCYVVFLSGAEDILARVAPNQGTGVVLLADILPTLLVKASAPFFIERVSYSVRVAAVVLLALISLVLVASAQSVGAALFGICLASVASGVGEITFLALTAKYSEDTVHAWGSGTGAAGVIGASSYLGLAAVLSPQNTLLVMLLVPALMGFSFKFLLSEGREATADTSQTKSLPWKEKVKLIRPLLRYMVPLYFVYLAEYLINQGLYEHLKWDNIFLGQSAQYRVYQTLYQLGVMISRSTGRCFPVKRLWILAALQVGNLVLLSLDTKYQVLPAFWLLWFIILFEGLLGGSTYVNAFAGIRQNIPPRNREFSLGAASVADTCGISTAGLIALGYSHIYRNTQPR